MITLKKISCHNGEKVKEMRKTKKWKLKVKRKDKKLTMKIIIHLKFKLTKTLHITYIQNSLNQKTLNMDHLTSKRNTIIKTEISITEHLNFILKTTT